MSTKIKILYLFLAIFVAYTLWPGDEEPSMMQGSFITEGEQGEMMVFGVTLGVTTLGEAELILKSRAKRALFILPPKADEDGNVDASNIEILEHNIEAFFPNMPDNSKMLLGLETEEEDMAKIRHTAHSPLAFPSGNIKLKIADEHHDILNAMKVITLTSIPRINLSPIDLRNKFGRPVMVHRQDEVMHFLYPEIGLDVILDSSGEAMLQFIEPSKFYIVLNNLGVTENDLELARKATEDANNDVLK